MTKRGVGQRPLDKGEKGQGKGGFGRGSEGDVYHGKKLGESGRRGVTVERLVGECYAGSNSKDKRIY